MHPLLRALTRSFLATGPPALAFLTLQDMAYSFSPVFSSGTLPLFCSEIRQSASTQQQSFSNIREEQICIAHSPLPSQPPTPCTHLCLQPDLYVSTRLKTSWLYLCILTVISWIEIYCFCCSIVSFLRLGSLLAVIHHWMSGLTLRSGVRNWDMWSPLGFLSQVFLTWLLALPVYDHLNPCPSCLMHNCLSLPLQPTLFHSAYFHRKFLATFIFFFLLFFPCLLLVSPW